MKTLCLIMLMMLMGVAGCSPHSVDQSPLTSARW